MSVSDQRVVVVGGSSGMGLAAARKLAAAGAKVVIAGRSQEKLDAARSVIRGEVEARRLDFTDEASVGEFFSRLGSIDHLVLTAAGRAAWGGLRNLEASALRKAFENKFWGYFHCAKHAIPYLRGDGSMVFFVGAACRTAMPHTSGLAAVNGAILAMARTLAKELAPLRVNAVSPGLVDTPAYGWMKEEERGRFYEQMADGLPVKRIGTAEEVADAVLFLVDNGFVTGTVIDIDGGASLG